MELVTGRDWVLKSDNQPARYEENLITGKHWKIPGNGLLPRACSRRHTLPYPRNHRHGRRAGRRLGRWRCVARRQKQSRKTREICKILQLREDDKEEEIPTRRWRNARKSILIQPWNGKLSVVAYFIFLGSFSPIVSGVLLDISSLMISVIWSLNSFALEEN